MLDTVLLKISIELTGELVEEYEEMELVNILRKKLCRIKYVDMVKLEESKINRIDIRFRFSYPRYYANYNSFLISTNEECIEVHRGFVEQLEREFELINRLEWLKERIKIDLRRVDVPLTYVSKNRFEQNKNILNIFREMSLQSKTYAGKTVESLILTNTKNIYGSDLKITVYDQSKKFKDMYGKKFEQPYDELSQRIRIELSKRIKRKSFTLDQFKEFEIFNEYVYKFTKIILDILFDEDKLKEVYRKIIEKLKVNLEKEQLTPAFTYKYFIYKYKDDIWDYKLLRSALKLTSTNVNTIDKAASTIRKELEKLEEHEDIKCFDILQEINNMRMCFKKILKGEGKK